MLDQAQSFSAFFAQILKLDQISKVLIHVANQDQARLFWSYPYTRHLLRQKCLEIHATNLEVLQAQTGLTFDEQAWSSQNHRCDLTDFTMRQTLAHHYAYQQILLNPEIAEEEFVLFIEDDFLLSKNWVKQVTELIHALSFEDLSSSGINLQEINFISLANPKLNSLQRYTHEEIVAHGVVYNTYINIYGSGQLLRTDTINTPHLGCYLVRKRALRREIIQETVLAHPAFDIAHAIAFRPGEFAYYNPVVAIGTTSQQQFEGNCPNLALQLLAVCQLLWQGQLGKAPNELAPELLLLLHVRGVLENLADLLTPQQRDKQARALWAARNPDAQSPTPSQAQIDELVALEVTRLQQVVAQTPYLARDYLLQAWQARELHNRVLEANRSQMHAWFTELQPQAASEFLDQARELLTSSTLQVDSWQPLDLHRALTPLAPNQGQVAPSYATQEDLATTLAQAQEEAYKFTHMDLGTGFLRLTHLYPPHVAYHLHKETLTNNLHKARLLNYQHNLYSEEEDTRDNRTFTYRHDHLMRKFVVYPEQLPQNLAYFYHHNSSCLDFTPIQAPSFLKLEQEQRLRLFPNTRFHKYAHTATQEDLENTMAYLEIFKQVLADDSIADQDFVLIAHAHAEVMPAWRERFNYLLDYISYINPTTKLVYLGIENHKNFVNYTFDDFKAVGLISNESNTAYLNGKVAQEQVTTYLEQQLAQARAAGTLTPLEQTRFDQVAPSDWRISYLTSYRASQPLMFMIRKAAIVEKFGAALMRGEPLLGWWSYEMLIYLFNFESLTTGVVQPFWAQSSRHKDAFEGMQYLSYDLVQDQQLSSLGGYVAPAPDTSYAQLLANSQSTRRIALARDEQGAASHIAQVDYEPAGTGEGELELPCAAQQQEPQHTPTLAHQDPTTPQQSSGKKTATRKRANCARRADNSLSTSQPRRASSKTQGETMPQPTRKQNAKSTKELAIHEPTLGADALAPAPCQLDQQLRQLFHNHVLTEQAPHSSQEPSGVQIPTTQHYGDDPLLPNVASASDFNYVPTLTQLRSWQTSQLDTPMPRFQTYHGTPYLARNCPEYLHYQQATGKASPSHAEVAQFVQLPPPAEFTGAMMAQLLASTLAQAQKYVQARTELGLWHESPQPNTNQQHESARAFSSSSTSSNDTSSSSHVAGTEQNFLHATKGACPLLSNAQHSSAKTQSTLAPRSALDRSLHCCAQDVEQLVPYQQAYPGLSTPLRNSTLLPHLRVARNGRLQTSTYHAFSETEQRQNFAAHPVSNHGFAIKDYLAHTPKFVINMRSNRERYQHFFAQPNTAGFTYFPAITGKDLTEEQRAEFFDLEGFKEREGRYPTYGEIGCTLSHLNIYRAVLSDPSIPDDAWILIAEDDVVLDGDWYYKVNKLLHGLQYHSHLDILLLSQVYIKHTNTQAQEAFLKSNYIYSKPHYYHQLGSPKDQVLHALELEAYRYIGHSTVDLPVGFGTLSYYKPCASSFYLIRKRALLHNRKLLLGKPFWYADSFQWIIKDTYFDNMAFSNPILAVQSAALESAIEGERLEFEHAKRQELRKIDIESASDYLSVSNVYIVRLAGLSDAQILAKFSNAKIIEKVTYVDLSPEEQSKLFDKQAYAARYGACELSDAEIERQLSYFKALDAIVNNGMHSLQSNLVLPDALIMGENFVRNYNWAMQYINTRMSLNTNCHILGVHALDAFATRTTPYSRAELHELVGYEFQAGDELRINGNFNYMHVKERKMLGAHSFNFIKFGIRGEIVGNYPLSVDLNDPAAYMHLHHESVVFHNPPSCFLPCPV